MEGRAFVTTWTRTTNGYLVWVKNRPALRAGGATFEEADEALWSVIMDATNDGENVREYDPPPPGRPEIVAFLHPAIIRVAGNARGECRSAEGLFSGGYCERCGAPQGTRTNSPLIADIGPEDAGFATLPSKPSYARPRVPYFSEAFLDLLRAEERDRFTWRRIERGARARKAYYELVGAEVVVPRVGVTELPVAGAAGRPGGWHCRRCGFRAIPHYGTWVDAWPLSYVCKTDLPDPLPGCFALGSSTDLGLCMRAERWRQILGNQSARGVVSDDVGVVPAARCDRTPEVPELGQVVAIPGDDADPLGTAARGARNR